MAQFTTITAFTLLFFCLFTISLARNQPNTNANDVSKVNDDDSKSSTIVMELIPMRFNPINRRFSIRSKHPCHHHKQLKLDPTVSTVSYGNDMLVAENKGKTISYGNDMLVAQGLENDHIHRHHDDDDDDKDMGLGRVALKRRHSFAEWKGIYKFPRYHRSYYHRERVEKKKEKRGGFMKFLDNYVF